MTLTRMCPKYREIYLLIVCAIGQFFAVINVAMLRALVTEIFGPTKKQNVTHLVQNTSDRHEHAFPVTDSSGQTLPHNVYHLLRAGGM